MNKKHLILMFLALVFVVQIDDAYARSYQIEVVVFSNNREYLDDNESWGELESLPNFEDTIPLVESENTLEPKVLDEFPKQLVNISKELRILEPESKFKTDRNYEMLVSAGWRQPPIEGGGFPNVYLHSEPIDLFSTSSDLSFPEVARLTDSFTIPSAFLKKVEGSVGIKVSRLLRIDLDFVYNNSERQVRLKESRNIKLEELNYFDHPLFGILVLVSPVEIEEPNS